MGRVTTILSLSPTGRAMATLAHLTQTPLQICPSGPLPPLRLRLHLSPPPHRRRPLHPPQRRRRRRPLRPLPRLPQHLSLRPHPHPRPPRRLGLPLALPLVPRQARRPAPHLGLPLAPPLGLLQDPRQDLPQAPRRPPRLGRRHRLPLVLHLRLRPALHPHLRLGLHQPHLHLVRRPWVICLPSSRGTRPRSRMGCPASGRSIKLLSRKVALARP